MKRCKDYVGVACVDGSCPKANAEEYEERCMDVIGNCNDCFYYKGCDDCAFLYTEYCVNEKLENKIDLKYGGKVMDNKELLNKVGETCSENIKCSECSMETVCRKDIYENHPELKKMKLLK